MIMIDSGKISSSSVIDKNSNTKGFLFNFVLIKQLDIAVYLPL